MNEVIIIVYPYKHNLCFRLGSVHNSRSYRNNPFLWSEETNINPSWKGQSEIKSGATFNQTPWLCCIHIAKQNCRVDRILIFKINYNNFNIQVCLSILESVKYVSHTFENFAESKSVDKKRCPEYFTGTISDYLFWS